MKESNPNRKPSLEEQVIIDELIQENLGLTLEEAKIVAKSICQKLENQRENTRKHLMAANAKNN